MHYLRGRRIATALISGIVGGALGAAISVVVNNALIEISITPFFAAVFGAVLLLLGCLMVWRKVTEGSGAGSPLTRVLMLSFSALVLMSGAACFALEKDWCSRLTPRAKVPLYVMLAISLSFAVSFSLIDLLNLYTECGRSAARSSPLVSSPSQITLVLLGAVCMGSIFGYLFGIMDVEDDDAAHAKLRNEERASLPIGFGIGGFVGFLNPLLAVPTFDSRSFEYSSMNHELDIDDDEQGDDWAPPARAVQWSS